MSNEKQSRRKMGAKKLEPIDWHEFANDAVLNGNMSTLYHRPVDEDASAYASSEALLEIEKRVARPAQSATSLDSGRPTVGTAPPVGLTPTVSSEPTVGLVELAAPATTDLTIPAVGRGPTVGIAHTVVPVISPELGLAFGPTVGLDPTVGLLSPVEKLASTGKPTSNFRPIVGAAPTVGIRPTVGIGRKRKVKPIRDVQDALTLAGHVLYKAMYGAPDGARSKTCAKGYRQLAAETHLDKDTVRDLISEFKEKGIVRETRTYDPDTRSAKTYEVLSYKAILQIWRDADLQFVTAGRKRPEFCTGSGEPLGYKPTVGLEPTVARKVAIENLRPTVGPNGDMRSGQMTDVLSVLQQITGVPVDQEAADRLIGNCRAEASDCTLEEIVEIAWSKAFLCRSGKIDNPIGFLITQVPKHFQADSLQTYRLNKRRELEAAAASAARDEDRRREAERELAEMEESQRVRGQVAERHRTGQGIELKSLLQDPEADDTLKDWARRMMKLGHRHLPQYL